MRYETITDIYSANEKIHTELNQTLAGMSETEATSLPSNEKWTIQQLVEHIAIVEFNITRICEKLLESAKTDGKPSDGTLAVSDALTSKWAAAANLKLEAPERVQPTGNVSITESFKKMRENREAFAAMRTDFESYDLSGSAFPHPYFGDLTATEWFILSGGHEARHTAQIGRLLEKVRQ